jgi:hypothetical protein
MRNIIFPILFVVGMLMASKGFAEKARDPFFPSGPRDSETPMAPRSGDWGRDPFSKPFEGTATSSGTPAAGSGLSGIIYSQSVRVAIIHGESYKEGSMVGGRRLVDIRRRSVVFMTEAGGREEVFLEDFSMKK